LEHIRDVHDQSQHLKTIEDELKGDDRECPGQTGITILDVMYTRLMDQERRRHEELLCMLQLLQKKNDDNSSSVVDVVDEILKCAIAHKRLSKGLPSRTMGTHCPPTGRGQGFTVGNH